MRTDVWKTLYTNDFDTNKYLYHYTSIETAFKIISSDSILFSPLSSTNDTSEAKIKMFFDPEGIESQKDYDNYVELIINYFNDYNKLVQLLCFSTDTVLKEDTLNYIVSQMLPKEKYYDISGRGFALPRMWAQYGKNNQGVCFVIDKDTLLKNVESKTAAYKSDFVQYRPFYQRFLISKNMMISLSDKIKNLANGGYTLLKLLNENNEFLQYNYFEKNINWRDENEYRIITLVEEKFIHQRLPIKGFVKSVRGIVLGENVEPINKKFLRFLIQEANHRRKGKKDEELNFDIKRICFSNRLYKLKDE